MSNFDLVSHRKSRVDTDLSGHAGNLPSERRKPDFPATVRQTSIEHSVQRRHSVPPPRVEKTENLVVRMANCAVDANRIGRRGRSHSRSPTPRSMTPIPRSLTPISERKRSCTPKRRAPPALDTLPLSIPLRLRL